MLPGAGEPVRVIWGDAARTGAALEVPGEPAENVRIAAAVIDKDGDMA